LRLLGATPREPRVMAALGRNLGQDLFDPPNVKGWPGGVEWVDTANLPARHAFLFSTAEALALIEEPGAARQQQLAQRQQAARGQPGAAAAEALRRRQLLGQGQAPAPGMAEPPVPPLQGVPPAAANRPGAMLQAQMNPRNLDITEYRILRGLDEAQLAALVLPLPPVGAEVEATTALGRLLLDPAYQLK